jgi:hypothetical protein
VRLDAAGMIQCRNWKRAAMTERHGGRKQRMPRPDMGCRPFDGWIVSPVRCRLICIDLPGTQKLCSEDMSVRSTVVIL